MKERYHADVRADVRRACSQIVKAGEQLDTAALVVLGAEGDAEIADEQGEADCLFLLREELDAVRGLARSIERLIEQFERRWREHGP